MKIDKATFDLMPAAFQAQFKPTAENPLEYTNGEEAVDGLKSALEKEKREKAEFGKKLADYDAAKTKEIEEARKKALEEARTNGDFAKIEADYKRQLKEKDDHIIKAEKEKVESMQRDAINNAASELSKMFVSPSLATPAIKSRLKAEIVDGKPIVRVLDKDGNASAASIEDLKKEFLTDGDLKASLVASKGSGGGSTRSDSGGGSTEYKADKDFDATKADPKSMIARLEGKGLVSVDDD